LRVILSVNLIFGAEASAFDDDRIGMVQDTAEDGGAQGAVVFEDAPSFCKLRLVVISLGARLTLADDLELCAMFVDREVAELIDNRVAASGSA
jgi:hypothetical protein